jgi:Spy/CpxP family protein refolding chaperone
MRGTWIKSATLLLAMTLSGTAMLAQQATSDATQSATPAATEPATQAAPQAATHCARGTTARLQLTIEQRKQLRQLRMSARDQAAIIRNDQTLSPEQRQAKMKELRINTRQQMKAVLTPAQQTTLANRRAERRARIADKLGLTPDQQSKLKDLFVSTRQQRQAVLQNTSLSNEQKKVQLSQIRQASKAQLATILTPEQLAKFHEMRKHHRRGMRG